MEQSKKKSIAVSDKDESYRKKLDEIRKIYIEHNPDRIQSPLFEKVTESKGYSEIMKHLIEKEFRKCKKFNDKNRFKHY